MKIGTSRRQLAQVDDENPYWISFSDIMSGLLVIFVLAALALILELTTTRMEVSEAIREMARAEQVRRDILREVEDELRDKNILVEISDNETVIRIPDSLLTFNTNQFEIPAQEEVRAKMREIGQVLYNAIVEKERWKYLDTIFVEGHTDSRPSARMMGNWGLSTYRAISAWNYWNETMEVGQSLSALRNHNGTPLFSVSGYGETRPTLLEQETEEDFQKNRRIDIRFTVRRPKIEEFATIKKLLGE